jgi:XRN 5'-3' exonuclease N-terminus
MSELFAALEYYAYVRLQNNPRFQHLQIRISGPNVPGEGELKIFDWLNSFIVPRAPSLPAGDSVVVVGSDADIVLQALATVAVQNLFVYIHCASPTTVRRNTVISVWKIARHLHKLFPRDSLTVRLDFIAIAIMNGNDYVPKLRGSTMSRLWRRYLKLRGRYGGFDESKSRDFSAVEGAKFASETLIDPVSRTFNWPFLCALVKSNGAQVPEITAKTLADSHLRGALNRARNGNPISLLDCSDTGFVEPAPEESDQVAGDSILYDGTEDGGDVDAFDDSSSPVEEELTDTESKDIASGGSEEEDTDVEEEEGEESDFDEYEDPDSAHIATLIALSGSSGKFYDTEQWLRTLLYTLHMYIDGYCPDYECTPDAHGLFLSAICALPHRKDPSLSANNERTALTNSFFMCLFCVHVTNVKRADSYPKPYAPSSKVLASYIESHDGDPHPTVSGPVSATPALTPLKAAFAMLPKHAAQYLPKPLEALVHDSNLYSKIFISDFCISMEELHRAVDRIPADAYTPEERSRGSFGELILLRRPTSYDRRPGSNPVIVPPGDRFPPIEPIPIIVRIRFEPTSAPPCFAWPSGSIPNMLGRNFKWAHASRGRGRIHGLGQGYGDSRGRESSAAHGLPSSGNGTVPSSRTESVQADTSRLARGRGQNSQSLRHRDVTRVIQQRGASSASSRRRPASPQNDSHPSGNRESGGSN